VQWQKSFVSNKALKNNIKALHQALSNYELLTKDKDKAYRNYTKKAHWFYQQLIEPVLKEKEGINNFIIVNDGELGHLPFETFLAEQAPQRITDYHDLHYLVNDFNISYNYSATLWKENKEAPKQTNNGQILAYIRNYEKLVRKLSK
jgi:hypothetical protein